MADFCFPIINAGLIEAILEGRSLVPDPGQTPISLFRPEKTKRDSRIAPFREMEAAAWLV
jgi:hypothetical protein